MPVAVSFGTDGVRGPADSFDPAWVVALGRAAVATLGGERIVIGRDTRASGSRLARLLAAGVATEGADPLLLGVAPTPMVAWCAAEDRCAAAVVSASHNPARDNGFKLFAPGGRKLSATEEADLTEVLDHLATRSSVPDVLPAELASENPAVATEYLAHLRRSMRGTGLAKMTVALDCANGAAHELAPRVFSDLGAHVERLACEPDGANINVASGSTHPEALCETVSGGSFDVGFAFDGDADRVLAVDEAGNLVDGDQIIAILALDRAARGTLARNAVAVTVMTNLGFRLAMAAAGIEVVVTPVGDKYVLEAMEREGIVLGGEQSGHVILADLATTGDGLLVALAVAEVMSRTGEPLSALAERAMTRLPQVLRNVEVSTGNGMSAAAAADSVADLVAGESDALGETGRVLVRPSGTEPLVRVMVEAPSADLAEAVAGRIADAVSGSGPGGAGRP